MPKLIESEFEAELLTLEGPAVGTDRPIVRAQVVYLGANPAKSMALPGRVMTEQVELDGEVTETRKVVADTGFTKYVFELRTATGALNKSRLMGAKTHPSVRGRPFDVVEHPDHLVAFDESRGPEGNREFLIVFERPEDKRIMDEYAAKARRGREAAREGLAETIGGRPGIR